MAGGKFETHSGASELQLPFLFFSFFFLLVRSLLLSLLLMLVCTITLARAEGRQALAVPLV